jgi:hypothetical protein
VSNILEVDVSDFPMDWWADDGTLNMSSFGEFLSKIKSKSKNATLHIKLVKVKTVLWIKEEKKKELKELELELKG